MRADGVPDVATCELPAREGMKLERQNAFPGADRDWLRAVDVLFPDGLDHHHLMTWNPLAQRAAQAVARELSGLGRLPDAALAPRGSETRDTDVLVVGGGRHGEAAARAAAAGGFRVILVDAGPDRGPLREHAGIELRPATRAVALYPAGPGPGSDEGAVLLALLGDRSLVVHARRVVVATGSHAQPVPFPGSDLPGVFAASAVSALLARGIVPGRRPAVVASSAGVSVQAREVAQSLVEAGAEEVNLFDPDPAAAPLLGVEVHPGLVVARALGFGRVRALECAPARGGTATRVRCDCVALAVPRAPAYELGAEAGAEVDWIPQAGGFGLRVTAEGATSVEWLFAGGACTGGRAAGDDAGRAAVYSLLLPPHREGRAAR
jgi:sarcosine oxidase subunit alpha